jgi:hypothetical protein
MVTYKRQASEQSISMHLEELGFVVLPKEQNKEQQTTRAERLAYFAALPTTDEHEEYLF